VSNAGLALRLNVKWSDVRCTSSTFFLGTFNIKYLLSSTYIRSMSFNVCKVFDRKGLDVKYSKIRTSLASRRHRRSFVCRGGCLRRCVRSDRQTA